MERQAEARTSAGSRGAKGLLLVLLVVLVGGGGVAVGLSWGLHARQAPDAGYDRGYREGLDAGQAQGIEQGRALELGRTVPATSRSAAVAAFRAGYSAGANDVFSAYDGGWEIGRPYVVVLGDGNGDVTYRIERREAVPAGCLPTR